MNDSDFKDLLKKIQVVGPDTAEDSAFVVCSYPPPRFPDDCWSSCSKCGRAIVHRPHAPKKPPKICSDCFRTLAPADFGQPAATPETLKDLVQFINGTQAGADDLKKRFL